MYTFSVDRFIKNAPADLVWDVISDVERYAEYAPNLSRAEKTSEGPTPSRRCYDTQGRGWNEACVLWREGEVYSYLVDTAAEDYPFPFAQLKGTWRMSPEADGVTITMRFDYTPKAPPPLGWLMHLGMKRNARPLAEKLLDNWQAEIMNRMAQAAIA